MEWIEVKIDNHELEGAMWVKCIAEIRKKVTSLVIAIDSYFLKVLAMKRMKKIGM